MKESYHPKAFLSLIRNVRLGLVARTKIVLLLENEEFTARVLAEKIGLSYSAVLHHLRLLWTEKIIGRKGTRPFLWSLTGAGQQRLTSQKEY
ncbi:MAG: winged helix-turn-helix domain-containing protein [Candidatus Bathyarchaeota archaeon]|nr:winged helix-turn-helix domain-containing protein [Candidatus Bathyarchaeota archaeon]MDH5732676.1 winged helix-turn-helix domain-containing protein [Candidatus Bathyarchaeota archaeon]